MEDIKNVNGFPDAFMKKSLYKKNQSIFLSSAIKFGTVPWKKQNIKTKVSNKAVIAIRRLELKWLHWQKFNFDCATDVKGLNNYEVIFPFSLVSLHVNLQFLKKAPIFHLISLK